MGVEMEVGGLPTQGRCEIICVLFICTLRKQQVSTSLNTLKKFRAAKIYSNYL